MTDYALTIVTALKDTEKFLVDGDEYEILSLDHVSPDDEAKITALFARLNFLTEQLQYEANSAKGEALAKKIRTTRIEIVSMLTTLPKEKIAKLPLTAQVRLLEKSAEATTVKDEDDEEDDAPAA